MSVRKITLSLCSLWLANQSIAQMPMNDLQTVIVPDCLLNHSTSAYDLLARSSGFQLIQAQPLALAELVAPHGYPSHDKYCGKYLNVSEEWSQFKPQHMLHTESAEDFLKEQLAATTPIPGLFSTESPYQITHEAFTQSLISQIKPNEFWQFLQDLSDSSQFPDRSAYSETGVKAAHWLQEKVLGFAEDAGRTDVTTQFIETGKSYKQPSLVVKIGNQDTAGIVVGAHMDTMDNDWWDGFKPGADDDGSGTVTVLELARVLISSHATFNKPVYLMWYSAEERGLVGSKVVVQYFKKKNIPVKAVLHMDMTGYQNAGDEQKMWVITDNVNKNLTQFIGELALHYSGVTSIGNTRCGYACSDHASWNAQGYPAAMPSESDFNAMNHSIHTHNDTMANLTQSHMLKYVKLGTAFVSELAEPNS